MFVIDILKSTCDDDVKLKVSKGVYRFIDVNKGVHRFAGLLRLCCRWRFFVFICGLLWGERDLWQGLCNVSRQIEN